MKSLALISLAALSAAALSFGPARAQQFALFAPFQPQAQQPAPQAAPPDAAQDQSDENAQLDPRLQKQIVDYPTREAAGTIVVDTPHTYLYFVLGGGKAIRYGIGVGRQGFTWSGVHPIVRKQEWPDWYPPPEMVARQPYLPRVVAGGPGNPLGARALYIGGTEYRIHGTNDPSSIGKFMSSGCIRMTNDNAIDLYSRVQVGAKVVVLPKTGAATVAQLPAGGQPLPPAPAAQGRERMTWNGVRPAGLY